MSNFHLITNPTPLSQANKLELGFRQLQKTVERKFGKKEDPSIVKSKRHIQYIIYSFIKAIRRSMPSFQCTKTSTTRCAPYGWLQEPFMFRREHSAAKTPTSSNSFKKTTMSTEIRSFRLWVQLQKDSVPREITGTQSKDWIFIEFKQDVPLIAQNKSLGKIAQIVFREIIRPSISRA